MRRHLRLGPVLVLALMVSACGNKVPPNLSPVGQQNWYKLQTVKALDTLRDIAITAGDQQPPVLTEHTVRVVVNAHTAILKVIEGTQGGWVGAVQAALTQIQGGVDPAHPDQPAIPLSASELQTLQPYIRLVQTILQEVAS